MLRKGKAKVGAAGTLDFFILDLGLSGLVDQIPSKCQLVLIHSACHVTRREDRGAALILIGGEDNNSTGKSLNRAHP